MAKSTPTIQPAQIDALTSIRGIAALWVILLHLQYSMPNGILAVRGIREIVGGGWLAVDLFFVLSGFIMMHIHGVEFTRPRIATARHFYGLRFIRIYPVHCLVLLLHIPLLLLALRLGTEFSSKAFSARSFVLSLFMLNGVGIPGSEGWNVPSWSVSSEWFAYLLFPIIACLVLRVGSRRLSFGIGLAILLGAWVFGGIVSDWQTYMLPFWGVLFRVTTEFTLGCLAYRFYSRPIGSRAAEIAAALAVATILVVSLWSPRATFDVLIIGAFVVLVVGLSQAHGSIGTAMQSRPIVHLGRISYSAYIVHALLLVVYARGIKAIHLPEGLGVNAAVAVLFLAAVVVCAQILYSVVEEPSRRWLRSTWLAGSQEHLGAASRPHP